MLYIEETTRQIKTRIMGHLGRANRKEKGNYLGDYILYYTTQPHANKLHVQIIYVSQDSAERTLEELIKIMKRKPQVNKQFFSWRLIQQYPIHPLATLRPLHNHT